MKIIRDPRSRTRAYKATMVGVGLAAIVLYTLASPGAGAANPLPVVRAQVVEQRSPASRPHVATPDESWAADTSADGTRPDAAH